MNDGIYIYGVIKANSPQEFGEIGIGDNGNSHVRTIGFKDIAAVVSNSPLMVYDSLAKEKVVKDLAVHQLVTEKVMERFAIVPVKFGTMAETSDEVIHYLEEGYALLCHELSQVEGKIELNVAAWWELPKILAVISHQNDEIREKQQNLASKGEQADIYEKVLFGQLIAKALQEEKARYQQLIMQTLAQGMENVCLHHMASDEIIFSAAFLLEKQREGSFHDTVQTLNQTLEDTVNFRVVGPLPPYSFSTILFEKLTPESIEAAKEVLGLTGEVTDKTLRDAYLQLAKKYHPDKNKGEETPEFQQIHTAYTTLKSFVENGPIRVEVYKWQKDVS
ncbi:MAG TPA: GvpL/GvpF family gas vesicle protein [Ktedonobacteraceae bacterium]|nr:GvpL/GvpF family gas vesicle protein [Ktedonobacteraceae bacterium]